jgi:hypothetical protein
MSLAPPLKDWTSSPAGFTTIFHASQVVSRLAYVLERDLKSGRVTRRCFSSFIPLFHVHHECSDQTFPLRTNKPIQAIPTAIAMSESIFDWMSLLTRLPTKHTDQ